MSEIMNRDFTPVIASHNMRELEDVCDHVGFLHKGGILLSRELEDMKFHIHKIQCVLPDQTKEEALLKELDVLKKAMKSKTFSGRSLRSSLKGSTWILVLLLLGFMVAFPVAELMLIGNQTDEIHRMTFAMICSYLIVPGFLVTMLAAVVNALNEFWYLFSRDKIDFYHSLPVTRSRFFWEKAIRGLVLYLVPYVIMYLLLYFGAVLALAIAGNILAGILSLCCVYLYGPVLGILLWVLEMMYFRTNMGLKEGMAEKISVFLSPVSISVALRTYSGQKNF